MHRSSGAGGHVNTTDSAVRITHIPTKKWYNVKMIDHNIKIKTCMQMLKARLYLRTRKRKKKVIERSKRYWWGHQIRSYVLPL